MCNPCILRPISDPCDACAAKRTIHTLTMSGICIWYRSIVSTPRRLRDSSHASTTLSAVVLQGDGVNFVATATGRRGTDDDEDEDDVSSRRSFAIRDSVSPWGNFGRSAGSNGRIMRLGYHDDEKR